jgi:hypothetical protein
MARQIEQALALFSHPLPYRILQTFVTTIPSDIHESRGAQLSYSTENI